jgi:membrane protease YdiL (CAAX protease family)
VPAEFATEAARMATAGAIVAILALPVVLVAWYLSSRGGQSLFPPVKLWRVPWGGFEVTFAFVIVALVPELLRRFGTESLLAGVLALPIQLVFLAATCRLVYPMWRPLRSENLGTPIEGSWMSHARSAVAAFARMFALSALAWVVLAPLVLTIHGLVTIAFHVLNLPSDEHPLTKLGGGEGWEQLLFLAQACVAAPLMEEILFRGLLLSWLIGGRERNAGPIHSAPLFPPALRPIVVMTIAVIYSAGSRTYDPSIFAGVLAVGLGTLWFVVRRQKRHFRAVYASAAFFAVVHSSIWPTPIPLFFLGLGLGWLAVRTRGVLVPAIVHGLFNAVSAIYVLRGAA